MTEHVIFIVYRQGPQDPDYAPPAVAMCWRATEADAIAVADRLRDPLGGLVWVAPLSDDPGLAPKLDDCADKGCQREAGHPLPHMSRYWNALTTSEVVEEWDDAGNREEFQ